MKKRILFFLLGLCLAVTAIGGCGKKKSSEKESEANEDTIDVASMSVDEIRDYVLKDIDKWVSIEDYSDLSVEVAPAKEVTEGAVEAELSSWLEFYPLSFSGSCVSGDSVNIDYVGKIDGEAFDGGTAEGDDLVLGSGSFIDNFEEQVEGMNVGDTKEIHVTFPDDYNSEDLAGKAAVFTVTLNYITKSEGKGELTDQWVEAVVEKENISDRVDALTADAFRAFVKEDLEQTAEDDYTSSIVQKLLDELTQLADFSNVPDDVKEDFIADEKEYQENYISNSYGMELSDYLTSMEIDEGTFNKQIEDQAVDYMQDVLTLRLIAYQDDIKVTEDEYNDYLMKYAEYYDIDTVEEFQEQYASSYQTDLYESLLMETVLEKLREDATVIDNPELANATETPAADATEASEQ